MYFRCLLLSAMYYTVANCKSQYIYIYQDNAFCVNMAQLLSQNCFEKGTATMFVRFLNTIRTAHQIPILVKYVGIGTC